MMQVFGPQGMEEMGVNIQDMLGNLARGGRKTKRTLYISEAREILIEQESEKLIDHEAAVEEAMERVQNQGIVFIDEIDKVARDSSSVKARADVGSNGVERDWMTLVE